MPTLEPVEITAGRLHLRPWLPGDAPAVAAACADPEIGRWLTALPHPYGLADAEHFVGEVAPSGWAAGTEALFAVTDATHGRLLGSVGLRLHPRYGSAEAGYWVAREARGAGVAAQALLAMTRWAFGAAGLPRVELVHDVANPASCGVARRAGFVVEGVLRDGLPRRGGGRGDAELHALLPRDVVTAWPPPVR